jgi:hypothetical protein
VVVGAGWRPARARRGHLSRRQGSAAGARLRRPPQRLHPATHPGPPSWPPGCNHFRRSAASRPRARAWGDHPRPHGREHPGRAEHLHPATRGRSSPSTVPRAAPHDFCVISACRLRRRGDRGRARAVRPPERAHLLEVGHRPAVLALHDGAHLRREVRLERVLVVLDRQLLAALALGEDRRLVPARDRRLEVDPAAVHRRGHAPGRLGVAAQAAHLRLQLDADCSMAGTRDVNSAFASAWVTAPAASRKPFAPSLQVSIRSLSVEMTCFASCAMCRLRGGESSRRAARPVPRAPADRG